MYALKNEWSQKDFESFNTVSRSHACRIRHVHYSPLFSIQPILTTSKSLCNLSTKPASRTVSPRARPRSSCRSTPCCISCSDTCQSTHTLSTTFGVVLSVAARSRSNTSTPWRDMKLHPVEPLAGSPDRPKTAPTDSSSSCAKLFLYSTAVRTFIVDFFFFPSSAALLSEMA